MPDPMPRERETEIRHCLMAFALWDAIAPEEQIAIARDLLAEVDRLREAIGEARRLIGFATPEAARILSAALLPGDAGASRPERGE